jgi:hypothetical protein|tara:strand:- start:49 stop:1785 length:1737 start_codon:yes stop_codon:yes gene_type:complete
MMLRELVMNAIEAASKTQEKEIKIRMYQHEDDGSDKLSIFNTGPGMTAKELRKACDMSSSIKKQQSLDENFGMGAKVASLAVNKKGIRFRSCCNGSVSEAVMGQTKDSSGKEYYTRFDYEVGKTGTEFQDVADITEVAKEEKLSLKHDWTEVVLFGNADGQNTVKDPFNKKPTVPLRWIANSLYQRFFKLPAGINIVLQEGTNSRGGDRPFEPFHSRIIRLSKKYKDIKFETVNLNDNLKGHYYFDGPDETSGGHNFSYKGNVASDRPFCGIVFKDEIYDCRVSQEWYHTAPKLGVPFGQKHISIVIELPEDSNVLPEGYREEIRWNDQEKLRVIIENFATEIREKMPQWLKEKIAELTPRRPASDTIKEELRNLLKEMSVISQSLMSAQKGQPSSEGREKTKHLREGSALDKFKKSKSKINRPPLTDVSGRLNTIRKISTQQIPDFIMIRTEEELKQHPDLHGRGARYVEETNEVYINMLFEPMVLTERLLKKEYSGAGPEEEVDNQVRRISEEMFQLRIGKAIVYSLAKRNKLHWTPEEVEKAFSTETLSIVADGWLDDITDARRKMSSVFKKLSA